MTHEVLWLTRIGSALLTLCGLPQAFQAKRKPSSTIGLSWAFLACWGLGELFMLGLAPVVSGPVVANYVFNVAIVGYLCRVKWQTKP